MTMFLFMSSKDALEEFGHLRNDILKGKDDRVKSIIRLLLAELQSKVATDDLVLKYRDCFSASVVNWEMEYDIAMQILQYEITDQPGRYLFEIINYLFSYLMSPLAFKGLFFLMHGFPIEAGKIDLTKIEHCERSNYVIYSLEEDPYESYILTSDEFENALASVNKISEMDICSTGRDLCVLQIQKTY